MTDRLVCGRYWIAVRTEDFAAADRLAEMYCDDLALIRTDLGWGGGAGRDIELVSPADRLRRVFTRLREAAEGQRKSQEAEWAGSARNGGANSPS